MIMIVTPSPPPPPAGFPILVIHGAEDILAAPRHAARLARRLGAPLVMIGHSAHFTPRDAAKEVRGPWGGGGRGRDRGQGRGRGQGQGRGLSAACGLACIRVAMGGVWASAWSFSLRQGTWVGTCACAHMHTGQDAVCTCACARSCLRFPIPLHPS